MLESVLNGMIEVADIVKQHEITLNSYDDLPAALDKLRGVHAQLLELHMVLQQQQSVVDALNKNVALLRQHVARTRVDQGRLVFSLSPQDSAIPMWTALRRKCNN